MYFQLIYTPIWIPFYKHKAHQRVELSNDSSPAAQHSSMRTMRRKMSNDMDLKLRSSHFKIDMHVSTSNNIVNSQKYYGTLY